MGVVGAVIGAVATVASTNKAVKAQKEATATNVKIAEEQRKQEELTYRRQQRSAIREAQIRRAQGTASVQAAGVASGSLPGGGIASIGSQLGSTLGFSSQMSGLSSNITDLGIASANATQRANTFGSIANIGSSVFQYSMASMK
jgi:hypothetical protein